MNKRILKFSNIRGKIFFPKLFQTPDIVSSILPVVKLSHRLSRINSSYKNIKKLKTILQKAQNFTSARLWLREDETTLTEHIHIPCKNVVIISL